ncbi:MAG: pseudouridine synthase [Azospira sp.]|jgi:tRNA pseudouridine65 synthase|nr:pseudouridine synthase [Azospira sp.]
MLHILHRDAALVVIDKPPGLLVHRSALDRRETRFAVQMLRDQIGRPVHPVHRLDRGTSGLLVFALDRPVARFLSGAFAAQRVGKTYLAVVRGWPAAHGTVDHPLKREPDDAEWIDPRASLLPQPAVTHWRRLATAELPIAGDRYPTTRCALLEIAPETGRRHQIRRHMKHVSHPILGDATHGKGPLNRAFAAHTGCARLLLHCARLVLPHPDGGTLDLVTPPGDDFATLLHTLGWQDALHTAAAPGA